MQRLANGLITRVLPGNREGNRLGARDSQFPQVFFCMLDRGRHRYRWLVVGARRSEREQ